MRLRSLQAKFRWMLSQKEREAKAKEAQLVTVKADNEGLRMQMALLRRRVNEVWRARLDGEAQWREEKERLHEIEVLNSQSLGRQSEQILSLKERLSAMVAERANLAKEKEVLRTCMEKYGEEVLELRDKVSEYRHRLTSGGHLDPLLYLPVQTLVYDDSNTSGITRRRSDNSRGARPKALQ